MPEVVKNVLSGMFLLGVLGYDFVYPVAPKSPFKEAKRALSNDRQIIERDIAKAARRIRHDAETNRRQGYPR